MGNILPLGALGLNASNCPCMYQTGYVIPHALVPLVLSKFLAQHVTGQFRLLMLAATCWMEVLWLPTVINMLEDLSHHKRPHLGCLSRLGAKGSGIVVFNPLISQRHVFHRQGFSSSVCQAMAGLTEASTTVVYQQCWKEWAGMSTQEGVPNNAISHPKLPYFLLHLFTVGLVWHTFCIHHSVISAFLEPHHQYKASNHPITSTVMAHFYLQCLLSHAHFDAWDMECLLYLWESWAPTSFLTYF